MLFYAVYDSVVESLCPGTYGLETEPVSEKKKKIRRPIAHFNLYFGRFTGKQVLDNP